MDLLAYHYFKAVVDDEYRALIERLVKARKPE